MFAPPWNQGARALRLKNGQRANESHLIHSAEEIALHNTVLLQTALAALGGDFVPRTLPALGRKILYRHTDTPASGRLQFRGDR